MTSSNLSSQLLDPQSDLLRAIAPDNYGSTDSPRVDGNDDHENSVETSEKQLVRTIDLRLCTIAGILCSLSLQDSSVLSAAAVTSMPDDLSLTGDRYSIAIFITTIASICCQLPATVTMRLIGPRLFFSIVTVAFGLVTSCTAWITSWQQMIVLRVLLGVFTAGIYPGLTYLISTWYTRKEQQLRFAYLQAGQVVILATGTILNYGLSKLDRHDQKRSWQW